MSRCRGDGRPLEVFFEQRDRPDCVTLHRRVLANPEVRRLAAHLDGVQLDMWVRTPASAPDGTRTTAHAWA